MEQIQNFIKEYRKENSSLKFTSKKKEWEKKNKNYPFEVYKQVFKLTEFLNNSYNKINLSQRFWHIENNKSELQYCPICKNKLLRWNTTTYSYFITCSKKCGFEHSRSTVSNNYKNNPQIIEKRINTCRKKYNVDHACQKDELKEQIRQTNIKNIGYSGPFANPEFNKKIAKSNSENKIIIKNKIRQTCLKKYGTTNYFKTQEFLTKRNKTRKIKYGTTNMFDVTHPTTKKYKNTDLIYQSSYEKYFLERMEKIGLLNKIKRGPTLKYVWENKNHLYYPDFILNNTIIEIKSSWTYNKCGKDKKLQLLVNTKLEAAKDKGYKTIILFSKKEIDAFINGLII